MSERALILNREQALASLGWDDAIVAARDAFIALEAGQVTMPQRLSVPFGDEGTHLSMPCYVSSHPPILSVKIVTVSPQNAALQLPSVSSQMLLHNPETGFVKAIMSGDAITERRTAAASVVASELFCSNPRILTVFGAGAQAKAHLEAHCHRFSIEKAFIICRNPEQARSNVTTQSEKVEICTDAKRALAISDIVCTATPSTTPLFPTEWLKPGAHINAVGSFTKDMCELEPNLIAECQVTVDHLPAAQAGAGELIQAANAGQLDWDEVTTLGKAISNKPTHGNKRFTLYKSVGVAVLDAFAAQRAFENALNRNP
ncbi:MAG: ornithine cyclodeaminase family protein [Fimbriimonadales bacterium]